LADVAGDCLIRRSGHGEHLATHVQGHVGGDESPASLGSLHDHYCVGQRSDDAVAAREVIPQRRGIRLELAEQQTAASHGGVEITVPGGIHPVDPTSEDADRPAALGQGSPMGGGVHAPCKTADHRPAGSRHAERQVMRHASAVLGGGARAHNRDDPGRRHVERATEPQLGRRSLEVLES
jgi:hypothetical protein